MSSKSKKATYWAVAILAVLWLAGRSTQPPADPATVAQPAPAAASPPESTSVGIGEEGRLTDAVLLAVDDDAWDAMIDAQVAGDQYGLLELITTGAVFAGEKGARVLVVDRGFTSRKVRVLEGETAGLAGWVQTEFVE